MSALNRTTIERIIAEEAKARQVSVNAVVGQGKAPRVKEARVATIHRVLRETGCTHAGLARAWGMSRQTVIRLASEPPTHATYDKATRERLQWFHGHARARQIAAGKDPNTIRDLSAWKQLGAGRNAA